MEINCKFYNSEHSRYCCLIENSKIPENVENVKFVGNHIDGKSNDSVGVIDFKDCEMQKIPKSLTILFPNLIIFEINNSSLQGIEKEDLKGLEKLELLSIENCGLEYLPGNLFEDMKNLRLVNFRSNQIKFIGKNLLDGLKRLQHAYFSKNKNINLFFSQYFKLKTLPEYSTLENLKREIHEKCDPTYFLNILDQQRNESKMREENLLEKISKLEEGQTKLKKSKEIMDDIKKFTSNESFKDIKVKVQTEEFKLNKFILAARSQMFAELFTKIPAAEELNLVDITADAFKIFIDFVYNNRLPQNKINSLEIFKMGTRMKVKKLKEFAAAKLISEINPKNAFEVLKYGNKHEELRKKAFEEVRKMFPKIELNDELAKFPDKIQILIDAMRKKEESMRAAEEKLEAVKKEMRAHEEEFEVSIENLKI